MKTILRIQDRVTPHDERAQGTTPTIREMFKEAVSKQVATDEDNAMSLALLSIKLDEHKTKDDMELNDDEYKMLKEACKRRGTGAGMPPNSADGPWYAHYYGQLVFRFKDAEVREKDAMESRKAADAAKA